mmetsp:Transcript_2858/g.7828  ORF Transcript_2858/g.7828 Transcript_2858/m.7828 type:complete len:92 (-) Transcript_2858:3233-3508(-)
MHNLLPINRWNEKMHATINSKRNDLSAPAFNSKQILCFRGGFLSSICLNMMFLGDFFARFEFKFKIGGHSFGHRVSPHSQIRNYVPDIFKR